MILFTEIQSTRLPREQEREVKSLDKISKAIKGLVCCVNLLCNECPYAKYEHTEHKFQCTRIMHKDLFEILFIYKGGLNNDIINNDLSSYS